MGTGLVVARREEDDSWSPPSALATLSAGWGLQARAPAARASEQTYGLRCRLERTQLRFQRVCQVPHLVQKLCFDTQNMEVVSHWDAA